MIRATALTIVALSLFIAAPAAAQSKSWKAVSKSVPSGTTVVFGANLAPIRATSSYKAVLQMFLAEEDEARQAFDLIKTSCSLDVPSVISDVTVMIREVAGDESPLVVLGLDGVDEAKLIACVESVGKQMGGGADVKLSSKKKGKITEYTLPGEPKKLYAAWLAPDVLAFTEDVNDKAKLAKLLAGKAPRGPLATMLGKVSTTAPVWFAVSIKEKESWGTILGGWGQLDIAAGTLTGNGHMLTAKAAEATAAVADAHEGLAEAKAEAAKQPLALELLDTVKITAAGAQVDITASAADKDIVTLLPQLEKIF